jgi:hypothetical protein
VYCTINTHPGYHMSIWFHFGGKRSLTVTFRLERTHTDEGIQAALDKMSTMANASTQCPQGHELVPDAGGDGTCDKCTPRRSSRGATVAVVAGGVAGAAVAPHAATAAVLLVGYTRAGGAAGSWAAGMQAAATVTGSAFAAAQSIGATGSLAYLGAGSLLVLGSGAVIGIGAGAAVYQLTKKIRGSRTARL